MFIFTLVDSSSYLPKKKQKPLLVSKVHELLLLLNRGVDSQELLMINLELLYFLIIHILQSLIERSQHINQ